MSKTSVFKPGYLYYIDFDDHTSGKRGIVKSQCVGWCIENHDKYAVFTWWLADDDDKELVDDSHEPFSILKSTVNNFKLLSRKKFL